MVVSTFGFPKLITLTILKCFAAHCLCSQFGFDFSHEFSIPNSDDFWFFVIKKVVLKP